MMVYKAMSHVMVPLMCELFPAPTLHKINRGYFLNCPHIFISTDTFTFNVKYAINIYLSSPNTYSFEDSKSILLIDFKFLDLLMLIWKIAFNPGSSKHGKALRASVGSNCVAASHLK
jgi:hypothetical protein